MSSEENYSSNEEWEEVNNDAEEVTCLFCQEKFGSIENALQHSFEIHNFNLLELQKHHLMDCYSFIKLINYIRATNATALTIMKSNELLWKDETYLTPVLNSDPWLMFDFEDFLSTNEGKNMYQTCSGISSEQNYLCHDDEIESIQKLISLYERKMSDFSIPAKNIESRRVPNYEVFGTVEVLLKKSLNLIKILAEKDNAKNMLIANLKRDNLGMREKMNKLIKENCGEDTILAARVSDDTSYFSGYDHPSMHYEMISKLFEQPSSEHYSTQDVMRTDTYKNAIHRTDLKGKTVLDVGCGTGILSMFCAESGAEKVYAIDKSDIISYTIDIIRENNFSHIIQPIHRRIEDDDLPFEKVDVIVSEWMGYFLLFEGMLDSLIYARNKYLKPDGMLLPDVCNLYLCGSCDRSGHEQHLGFWTNVYGFRMNCIANDTAKEAVVRKIDAGNVITTHSVLQSFNLYTCQPEDTSFTTPFSLTVTSEDSDIQITALVGYFDVHFNASIPPFSFSTSPKDMPTHWNQTIFYLREPINVTKGQIVSGELSCKRCANDKRSLEVVINIERKTYYFSLGR